MAEIVIPSTSNLHISEVEELSETYNVETPVTGVVPQVDNEAVREAMEIFGVEPYDVNIEIPNDVGYNPETFVP